MIASSRRGSPRRLLGALLALFAASALGEDVFTRFLQLQAEALEGSSSRARLSARARSRESAELDAQEGAEEELEEDDQGREPTRLDQASPPAPSDHDAAAPRGPT